MIKLKRIGLLIVLWFGSPIYICAQGNFLWIQDGNGSIGSNGNTVSVMLANGEDLGGFQLTLNYDYTVIQVEEVSDTDMTSGMEVYDSEPEPGQLNIMVLDMDGNNIPSGSGRALEIQFTVSDSIESTIAPLELSNVVLSDEEGNTLYSEYGSGYFFVNGVNAMRIGGGIESVSVDLYNTFTVGGVQFTIAFDPELVILEEINTTPRSNAMDLSYSDIGPGMITVLLYSFNLDSVMDNSGSILLLEFSYLSEYSGIVNLDLSNVAVSNMDGITEEVETFDGELYLMDDEGGDDGPPECVLDCPGIDEAGEPFDPGFCEWFTNIQGDACFDDCDDNEDMNFMFEFCDCLSIDLIIFIL